MGFEQLFADNPVFETDRLIMRELVIGDAEDYFELASGPIVSAHTTWDKHDTLDDSVRYLKNVLQRNERREGYYWGIVYKPTGKLIGRTGLIRIDPEHGKAELGYVISHRYWNQGITTEATRPIIDYSFNVLGLNRIEARCNYDNPGSYRVMEKLGLKLEGILRKQLKIKDEFKDQLMYAIIRSDYYSNVKM